MPDISMCADIGCPSRLKCYRYTAHPCKWRQTYGMFGRGDDDKCDMFWDNKRCHNRRDPDSDVVRWEKPEAGQGEPSDE